jgi:hypothetical protein
MTVLGPATGGKDGRMTLLACRTHALATPSEGGAGAGTPWPYVRGAGA